MKNLRKELDTVGVSISRFVTTILPMLAILLTTMLACDVLDKDPVGMVTDEAVYADESLVDAYTLDIYAEMEFAQHDGYFSYNQLMDQSMGQEVTTQSWQAPYQMGQAVIDQEGIPSSWDGTFDEWPYENIRRANDVIEKLQASNLNEEYVDKRIAEMRFLRAFMYFNMVKRYGGVPLITEVQNMDDPEEEIFVERESEQAIYDFIAEEMDAIVPLLPADASGSNHLGRATKGAALALKSRAMLYAASIAEFGDVQMDGLLGIPSQEAEDYWQASYDASMEIIESLDFELFNEYEDPIVNYRQLFVTEIASNSEAIFGELFDGEGKAHEFTYQSLPPGYALGWGSNNAIPYHMVELFEYEDGSSGVIPHDQLTSQEWTVDELYRTKDPRLRASIFYQESTIQDFTVYFHKSTIVDDESITSGSIEGDWPASGPEPLNDTGMLLRKRVNEDLRPTDTNTEGTDYIIFRLGEIYLNLAEAAYYLNRTGDALFYLNEIRQRAAMPDIQEVTEEVIREERQRELAFEGHRYWDFRRWRIAVEEFNGKRLQGLRLDYNWDTQSYQVTLTNAEGGARVFQDRHYYLPLGVDRLAENPNLVENPGY